MRTGSIKRNDQPHLGAAGLKEGVTIIVLALLSTVVLASAQTTNRSRRTASSTRTMNEARNPGVELFEGREVVAGQVLVKLKPSISSVARQGELRRIERVAEGRVIREIGGIGVVLVQSARQDVRTLVNAIQAQGIVDYVEPNFIVREVVDPNDPLFSQLWGLKKIQAPAAWDKSTGSRAVVVGVVDTGIAFNHPDLAANIWSAPASFKVTIGTKTFTCPKDSHGYNAITGKCTPTAIMDDNSHGTHVSGTIGAVGNNGKGVVGVNWATSIMGLKFLDSSGGGNAAGAIDAIEFAIQAKKALGVKANVRVLSNSWAGGTVSNALRDEIIRSNDSDILFVAAAGNNGSDNDGANPIYPASYEVPNIVAVAATGVNDDLATFSNYGKNHVHLGAPGVDILSTVIGDTYKSFSGTSMATPHVSGAAALILSRCPLDTPTLKKTLLDNVDLLPSLANKTVTGGRLNVYKAITSCSP